MSHTRGTARHSRGLVRDVGLFGRHKKSSLHDCSTEDLYKEEGWVVLLLKALYGLKQASREWYKRLTDFLLENGWVISEYDPCIFVHPIKRLIMIVYVDDILIAGEEGGVSCSHVQTSLREPLYCARPHALQYWLSSLPPLVLSVWNHLPADCTSMFRSHHVRSFRVSWPAEPALHSGLQVWKSRHLCVMTLPTCCLVIGHNHVHAGIAYECSLRESFEAKGGRPFSEARIGWKPGTG